MTRVGLTKMKAEVGSLLFIKDENDETKKRPFICVHVFRNDAGVPYDWLVIPITSTSTVGMNNLALVTHQKLTSTSYAKINNVKSISWSDEIEVARTKFREQYVRDVTDKLGNIFKQPHA